MVQCSTCGSTLASSARYCPNCGTPVTAAADEPRPATHRSTTQRVGMVLFPLVLIGGAVIFIQYLNPSVHSVIKQQPVVAAPVEYGAEPVVMTSIGFRDDGGDLVFSLEDLKRYRLVRFEYRGGQTPRSVMAYLAPTGQLVTAISYSEHCGSTEFTIKENKIFCARCPSNWDMMTMEAYACCAKYFPDPIPSRVDGSEVRVPKLLVERWAGRL